MFLYLVVCVNLLMCDVMSFFENPKLQLSYPIEFSTFYGYYIVLLNSKQKKDFFLHRSRFQNLRKCFSMLLYAILVYTFQREKQYCSW